MTYSPELLSAVAVLDQDQPGWWRKVDLGTFTLHDENCVIGQVYGVTGLGNILDKGTRLLRGAQATVLIFCPNPGSTGLPPTSNRDQWRSLIEARVAADNLILSAPPCEESEAVEGHERVAV